MASIIVLNIVSLFLFQSITVVLHCIMYKSENCVRARILYALDFCMRLGATRNGVRWHCSTYKAQHKMASHGYSCTTYV
jgi:hypothetical protein